MEVGEVGGHLDAVVVDVVGDDVGGGEIVREQGEVLAHDFVGREGGVAKGGHPVVAIVVAVVVVHGVVRTGVGAHVDGGDAVVHKGRVVGAGAQDADLARRQAVPDIVHGQIGVAAIRVDDFLHGVDGDLVEVGRRRDAGVRAGGADVDVEVRHRGGVEPGDVFLDELGRAEETVFFGVPRAEHNGSLGLPACLQQRAVCLGQLDHDGGAAVGVCGPADDPRITVIAQDDDLVLARAIDDTDRVPDVGGVVLHDVVQVQGDAWRWSRGVGRIERADPGRPVDLIARRAEAIQRLNQLLAFHPGNRDAGNAWRD